MSNLREQIRAGSRLARMRQGNEVAELASVPSMPEVRVMMVPLTEAEVQAGVMRAASVEVIDNAAGIVVRNRAGIHSDVWHSLRDPSDLNKKVFDSVEDMIGDDGLAPGDIDVLADTLSSLMDYASPSIDGLSDKELDDLKKAFGETDWSGLTGRQWAAVKIACQALFPELLAVKLRGITSIDSSTSKNESDEST